MKLTPRAWDFLIVGLTDIPFGSVGGGVIENAHDAWKDLIDKYEVSDEKRESLNEVRNWWNNCKIEDTGLVDPDIWFQTRYTI